MSGLAAIAVRSSVTLDLFGSILTIDSVFNVLCCSPCVMSKLWATSMDHPRCGFVNHFLIWLVVFILVGISGSASDPVLAYIIAIPSLIGAVLLYYMHTVLRLNMRRKHHVGNPQCSVGDCFFPCCCFTSCCSVLAPCARHSRTHKSPSSSLQLVVAHAASFTLAPNT
jgi:hypothetical protein